MSLEHELRQLFGETEGAPWPGEREAFDRFLHRRARRGRAVVAAAGLALVALLGAAVLVARVLPQDRETIAPAGGVVRVPEQGFELPVPAGWKVERELTGTGSAVPGGAARSSVVGVVLVPRSGEPRGATITVAADDSQAVSNLLERGASRRADGRLYKQLRPGSGKGAVGQYAIAWPVWPGSCRPIPAPADQPPACAQAAWRVLLVTGTAAPGDTAGSEQVQQVMRQIVVTVRPIGNAVRPPPPPTVPPDTKVLLGKGGSDAAAWEAWIEPIQGNNDSAGFMVRFPRATPKPSWHWEQLEPGYLHRDGVYTQMDCLSWLPGSGLLLSGLAREDAATVRIELAGQAPVMAATFGRDQPVPWVAFMSPPLPAGSKLDRVVALDAAGKTIGTQERPFEGHTLCRPRAG
jgi:hypothetical protein